MNEIRSCMVGFRLTEAERRKLQTLARSSGLTMTGVVSALLDQSDAILTSRPRVVVKRTTEQRAEYSANANRGAVEVEAQHAAAAR